MVGDVETLSIRHGISLLCEVFLIEGRKGHVLDSVVLKKVTLVMSMLSMRIRDVVESDFMIA